MTDQRIGVLDPEGKYNNPLTDKPYSDNYKELAKKWSSLPAYKEINNILNTISSNQITIVISSTGSGKTVIFPRAALHTYKYNAKIAITMPKQIIAKSAAEYAAKTLDVELGQEVGYRFRGESKISGKNKLLYATDGTIVAMLMNNPKLPEFDMVIIDEAHERKIQIDFLLYLLRNTLKLRPEFKVIIMSATINEKIFTDYFNLFTYAIVDLKGERLYPIESIYLKEPIDIKEYINKSYEILTDIYKKKTSGDVLIFVTSVSETDNFCKLIDKKKEISNVFCISMYAKMGAREQILAQSKDDYKDTGNFNRKLVVSTNVAESSLTVDGIKYVIDCGYELASIYDPVLRLNKLEKVRISQAQVRQRMGRAGRTGPGICYHLYTEDEFNKMIEFPEPSIRVNNLTFECLRLLYFPSVQTNEQLLKLLLDFIEPPREAFITSALDELIELNLINSVGITVLGKAVIDSGINDARYSIATLAAYQYRLYEQILRIEAMVSACYGNLNNLFISVDDLTKNFMDNDSQIRSIQNKLEKSREKLYHKYGDHLALLNIFDTYRDKGDTARQNYCYKHFIKQDVMDKAMKYYSKNLNMFKRKIGSSEQGVNGLFNFSNKISTFDDNNKILFCLLYGFRNQIAYNVNPHRGSFGKESGASALDSEREQEGEC